MGFKIKNITYLLNKKDKNYNKTVVFKINKNLSILEYNILPYQEIIFDSNLLPLEIKKMEMMGMIQCTYLDNNYMDSINNPKVIKEKKPIIKNKITEEPKKKKVSKIKNI